MTKKLILLTLSFTIVSLRAMVEVVPAEDNRAHVAYLAAKHHGKIGCDNLINVGYSEKDFFNALIEAQNRNDIPSFKFLAKNTHSALRRAAAQGNCQLCKVLIEECDASASEKVGSYYPLHVAAFSGDEDTVVLLLNHGADVHCKTELCQNTPLHIAANKGNTRICELLISHGAHINAKLHYTGEISMYNVPHVPIQKGWTPLHCAASANQAETCKFLLNRGAQFKNFDDLLINKQPDTIKTLLSNTLYIPTITPENLKESGEIIRTALLSLRRCAPKLSKDIYYKILQNDKELRDHLLNIIISNRKMGEKIPQRLQTTTIEELTDYTLEYLYPQMVVAKTETANKDAQYALEPAFADENLRPLLYKSVLSRLLSNEELIENREPEEPIEEVQQPSKLYQYKDIGKLVIAFTAACYILLRISNHHYNKSCITNLNSSSTVKDLVVYLTAKKRGLEGCHYLTETGQYSERDFFNALVIAHNENNLATLKVLNKYTSSALHRAAKSGNYNLCKVLIEECGTNVNVRIDYFPLHYAVYSGNEEMINLLIEHGADINCVTERAKVTPLHIAALEGSTHICEILISRGADMNAKLFDYTRHHPKGKPFSLFVLKGWTPLDCAYAYHHATYEFLHNKSA